MLAELDSLDSTGTPTGVVDIEPLNGLHYAPNGDYLPVDTAKFDSDTLVLPLFPDTLGKTGAQRFDYWVRSGTIETGYVDAVGSPTSRLTFDPQLPALKFTAAGSAPSDSTSLDLPGRQITVTKNAASYASDHTLGELFVHFHNQVGAKAQVMTMKQAQSVPAPSSLLIRHAQSVGAFLVGAKATSGLPVTVSAAPSTVCTYSAGYVTPRSAGVCTVTLSQPGNAEFAAATTSAYRFGVVGSTRSTVSVNDTTVTTTQAVTVTVVVAKVTASAQVLDGSVRVYDGTTLIKVLTVPSTGRVSYVWTSRSRGTHKIKAVYGGGSWFSASASNTVGVVAS
jgi:hypothetical protein